MSVQVTTTQMDSLRSTLLNTSGNTPLHERFRSLFMLKAVGGDQVVEILSEGLSTDPSPLLKHELAYVLGQMGNDTAIPVLEGVLINEEGKHCSMVRHEAAEALGALSSVGSLGLLRKYLGDGSREVRETCEVAIGKIEWDQSEEGKKRVANPDFPTVDPAPSSSSQSSTSIPTLQSTLNNTHLPLFERYRAMFALRDYGSSSREAVLALASGFSDQSALFRHEIAYIFGQLSSPYSVPSLVDRLEDSGEDDMVRHEAAEALGGIASDGAEEESKEAEGGGGRGVLDILKEWAVKEDAPLVVRESCQVAIDMWEYENSTDQFNPLDKLTTSVGEKEKKAHTTGMERSAHSAVVNGTPVVA